MDLLDSFDVYVIAIKGADRPYVSTTPPSEERLEVARREGWEVRQVRMEMVRSPLGREFDRLVQTWDRRVD